MRGDEKSELESSGNGVADTKSDSEPLSEVDALKEQVDLLKRRQHVLGARLKIAHKKLKTAGQRVSAAEEVFIYAETASQADIAEFCADMKLAKLAMQPITVKHPRLPGNKILPLLYAACWHGRTSLVTHLITQVPMLLSKPCFKEYAKEESPPLMFAVQVGHLPIVQVLLEQGANANAQNAEKNTALYFACSSSHIEATALLLRHGAKPSAAEQAEIAAHKKVYEAGAAKAKMFIIEKLKKDEKLTPAEIAFISDPQVKASFLEEYLSPEKIATQLSEEKAEASMTNIETILFKRAQQIESLTGEKTRFVQIMTQYRAEQAFSYQDSGDAKQDQAAMLAFCGNIHSKELAMRPIKVKHPIDSRDEYTTSLLYAACWYGKTALVTHIITQTPSMIDWICQLTEDNSTSLMFAAQGGHIATLRVLLERGAQINVQNAKKITALGFACLANHSEAAALLLRHGAKWSAGDEAYMKEKVEFANNHDVALHSELLKKAVKARDTYQAGVEKAVRDITADILQGHEPTPIEMEIIQQEKQIWITYLHSDPNVFSQMVRFYVVKLMRNNLSPQELEIVALPDFIDAITQFLSTDYLDVQKIEEELDHPNMAIDEKLTKLSDDVLSDRLKRLALAILQQKSKVRPSQSQLVEFLHLAEPEKSLSMLFKSNTAVKKLEQAIKEKCKEKCKERGSEKPKIGSNEQELQVLSKTP